MAFQQPQQVRMEDGSGKMLRAENLERAGHQSETCHEVAKSILCLMVGLKIDPVHLAAGRAGSWGH